jgi:hypothetical protein
MVLLVFQIFYSKYFWSPNINKEISNGGTSWAKLSVKQMGWIMLGLTFISYY